MTRTRSHLLWGATAAVIVAAVPHAAAAKTAPGVKLLCGPTKTYQLVCIVAVRTGGKTYCGIGPYRQDAAAMDLLASVRIHRCRDTIKAKS
jgi:hypothetical protein